MNEEKRSQARRVRHQYDYMYRPIRDVRVASYCQRDLFWCSLDTVAFNVKRRAKPKASKCKLCRVIYRKRMS